MQSWQCREVHCLLPASRGCIVLSYELELKFGPHDLLNLGNHDIYIKLMIDGSPSRPFSAITIPPSGG